MTKTILLVIKLITKYLTENKQKNEYASEMFRQILDVLSAHADLFMSWLEEENQKKMKRYLKNDVSYLHKNPNDGLKKEMRLLVLSYYQNKNSKEIESILSEEGFILPDYRVINKQLTRLMNRFDKEQKNFENDTASQKK